MIPQSLISYIETEIIPRYKDFDKAITFRMYELSLKRASSLPDNIPEQTNAWFTSLPLITTQGSAATGPPTILSPERYWRQTPPCANGSRKKKYKR